MSQGAEGHLLSSLPRYQTLPHNIHSRGRGGKKTNIPIYRDSKTPTPFHDISSGENIENHLCLDELDVGIGCCSLQVTVQAPNLTDARWLHDQTVPLAPIFLAMTAAVPIWKGYLTDTDVRWQRFGDVVDDRRQEELETIVSDFHQKIEYSVNLIHESPRAGLGTGPICLQKSRQDLIVVRLS